MAADTAKPTRKHDPPTRRPLEFLASGRDHSLAEFEHQFGSTVPQIVKVTKDGYAEDRKLKVGQVLTFQAISKQERVVARVVQEKSYPDLYSIPVTVNQSFTILDRDGKATARDGCLYGLLKTHKLPLKVQFSRGNVHKAKDVSRSDAIDTSHMDLLYKFNETHVLCNLIKDDTVLDDVIYVPLHASSIRVALVTGVSGMSNEVYRRVKENIDYACLAYEYDLHYGKIAVGVHKAATMKGEAVTRFSKPDIMVEFALLFSKQTQDGADSEQSSFYDVPVPKTSNDDNGHYDVLRNVTLRQSVAPNKIDSHESCVPKKTSLDKPGAPKPIASPRSLPQTPPKSSNLQSTEKESMGDNKPTYTNDIPRGEATAFVNQRKETMSVESATVSQRVKAINNTNLNPETTKTNAHVSEDQELTDICKLTIDDVCEYLKRLRLDKHVEKFRAQMVDGELLKEVDEDLLVSDFGFMKIEAKRLMKFVKDGHIPK